MFSMVMQACRAQSLLGVTKHLTLIDLFAEGNKSDEKERRSMGKEGNYNLKSSRGFFVHEGLHELLNSVIIAKMFHWFCLHQYFGKIIQTSDLTLTSVGCRESTKAAE